MYPTLTWQIAAGALVIGLILTTAGAYFPARGCSKRSIVDALRGVD